jgi:hypothetical protein
MKAVSIRQPYASLICSGIKNIENRTWNTKYRGDILIHACGKSLSKEKTFSVLNQQQWEHVNDYFCTDEFNPDRLEYGAIIGSVKIIDCVNNHESIWADKTKRPGIPIWNWVLSEPQYFDIPIENVKGKLSLWDFDIDGIQVNHQY